MYILWSGGRRYVFGVNIVVEWRTAGWELRAEAKERRKARPGRPFPSA
jgi:hypothetical protein